MRNCFSKVQISLKPVTQFFWIYTFHFQWHGWTWHILLSWLNQTRERQILYMICETKNSNFIEKKLERWLSETGENRKGGDAGQRTTLRLSYIRRISTEQLMRDIVTMVKIHSRICEGRDYVFYGRKTHNLTYTWNLKNGTHKSSLYFVYTPQMGR